MSLYAVNTAICDEKKSVPNIVLILADDLSYGELGCYGQSKIKTPNLDRLAKEGMRLTQHYSGAPVCAPSRCVLMTGLHSGHAQIRGNQQAKNADGKPTEGQYPITAEAVTIAELLQKRGYATGAFGKWGLGPVGSSGEPHAQGFDLFFGYNCQAVAHSYYPAHLWRNAEKVPLNGKPIPGHKRQPEGAVRLEDWMSEKYAPAEVLKEAVKFIGDHRSQPFFLYLPFIEPHVALQPPQDLVEAYPAEWDERPYRGQCGYLPHPRPHAGYAALITSLDRHVGTILKKLEDEQLLDKTLIIFSSDNGTTHEHAGDETFDVGGADGKFFNSTAGLRGRKGSLHEGGIRVPMIARWPGHIAPNSTSDFASYFPDHLPTLCEVAGINPPPGLDGISILPTLTGKGTQTPRNPMVWVFPEYGGQVAVRIGKYKVVRKNLQRPKQPSEWEVYDIEKDRTESLDLAAEQGEIIAQAKAVLRREVSENKVFPITIPGL
jgi:arylsulfatase A-like enzyme